MGTNLKPVCDFLLVINTNWHDLFIYEYQYDDIRSRTVSMLSQIIVQILDTAFLSPLWVLRGNVLCSS